MWAGVALLPLEPSLVDRGWYLMEKLCLIIMSVSCSLNEEREGQTLVQREIRKQFWVPLHFVVGYFCDWKSMISKSACRKLLKNN